MADWIHWDAESGEHIRSRSQRYPGAKDLDPDWTQEVLEDPEMVFFDRDPESRVGASRFIGESPSAGSVLVVIAYRDLDGDPHGVNAWPATGHDLAIYTKGPEDGQND